MKRWGVLLIILLLAFVTGTAFAHERIVSGDYALTLGWLDEPPIVGFKNAALVEVATAKDDKPVAGAEGTLTAQIIYGGQSKDLLLTPLEGQAGAYVGDFIPTQRGTYTLKIGGTINSQTIDVRTDIEEVVLPDSLAFPPLQADLQKSIDTLQSDLNTTRLFAIVGAVLGIVGVVAAAVALGRSRK